MKKYILLAMSAVVFGFTSCSEDEMDKVNVNNQNPSSALVSANLQITDAIMSTAFSTVSGDYAFYTSSLTEQLFGTGNNQLKNAELRKAGELAAPSTFNNVWNGTYGNLLNIKEMIDKVNNGTANSGGMYDVLGAAQVLWVVNFGILTDMHGDIPYSEALQGAANMSAKADSQEDVYKALLATIDDAIANLEKAQGLSNIKNVDIAFAGNMQKWLATAYAVKARYLIHQTCVDSQAAQKSLAAAQKAQELGFSGFTVTEFNGVTCDNPWSAFVWSRGYTAPSKTVTDLMGDADPRISVYCYDENPTDVVAAPGDEDAAIESQTWCYPSIYDSGSQPVHIMSAHELYFIMAEAKLRLGQDATEEFQKAVAISVDEWLQYASFDVTGAEGQEYAESLGTPDLRKVFVQKYIAGAIDEQVETYNDIRRCMGMGETYINMTNPRNIQGGLNRWPYLLPYGQSSLVSNPSLKEIAGDGTYIYQKNCWLFGGK